MRFFTEAQQRDAAYICADNIRRMLPAISQSDPQAFEQLAKDMETAEVELHQKMPY